MINERYADHCFSEGFDPSRHDPELRLPWCAPGSKDQPAFDQLRYELSAFLPSLIDRLPGSRVQYTSEARNYVYAVTVQHPGRGDMPYDVFFQMKKTAGRGVHLDLSVVSSYSPEHKPALVKRPDNVRFLLLAGNIYRGRPLQPHRR